MDKTKVTDALYRLGFHLTEYPDMGYVFRYEGLNIFLHFEKDDDEFIRLALPCIFEGDNDNRIFLLDLVNEANIKLKYAKIVLRDNEVWVLFETDAYSEQALEQTLQHGILSLQAAHLCFCRLVTGLENLESFEHANEPESMNPEEDL